MWKVLTRFAQTRSLSISSSKFYNHKESSFSDPEFVQKKQRYRQTDDFDHPEKKAFRNKGYNDRDRDGNSDYSQSRHTSFDATVEDAWGESPAKNNRYSSKRDSYSPRYRNEEREEYGEDSVHKNANLSEIGKPGKWKVGAGFVKESDRLREIQNKCRGNFNKMAKFTVKRDPGIRRQAKVLEEFSDPSAFSREEELDGEVDVMKLDKVYDKYQQGKRDIKEMTQLRIVKQKYFKDSAEEKTLTWSDKEHIRFLHNSDPQHWTIEMIAEHFRIEPHVAKAVASAKWIPKKSKLQEENSSNSSEISVPVHIESEHQTVKRQSSEDKQRMTWQEATKSMGLTHDAAINDDSKSKPALVEPEDVNADKDLVLQYLFHGSPSKWASQKPNRTNFNVDEIDGVQQVIENKTALQVFPFQSISIGFLLTIFSFKNLATPGNQTKNRRW